MRNSDKLYWIYFFLLFMLAFIRVNAQEVEMKASAPAVVTVGQPFNYTVSGDFDGKVILPDMPGIRLIGGPSTFVSQQSSNVNGRLQLVRQVSYSYTFVADQEGDITIPPAKIVSGRKEYFSNPLQIKVIKGTQQAQAGSGQSSNSGEGKNESIFVQMIPSRKSLYLGEQLVLISKIYTQEPLQISDIKAPALEGFWKEDLKGDESSSKETLNGQNYLSLSFNRYLLTAQKPGNIQVSPVIVNCLIQKRVKSGRLTNPFDDPFFNDPFFDRVQTVPQSFSSNPLTIRVKPLPANPPAGFNGAVGSFTLKAALDKEEVKVNDAVSLKLTIGGQGNLILLKPVKVDFPPDLEIFDPKTDQQIKNTLEGSSGTVNFEYLIIPRHAGKFRISPIIFTYFDPLSEKYKTLQTNEFNFIVEKSGDQDESFLSSPGEVNQQGKIMGVQGKNVVSLANDILFIRLSAPNLKKTGQKLFGSIIFNLTYISFIILFIGIIIFQKERIRRNADIYAVRNRKARKLAQKRLSNAYKLMQANEESFYEEILKTLWGYLSDKLGINVSELSRILIHDKLQSISVSENILKQLWQVMDDCELARYGTGFGGDKKTIYNTVINLISELQESIK